MQAALSIFPDAEKQPRDYRFFTALHEAGHVAAGMRNGLYVASATIDTKRLDYARKHVHPEVDGGVWMNDCLHDPQLALEEKACRGYYHARKWVEASIEMGFAGYMATKVGFGTPCFDYFHDWDVAACSGAWGDLKQIAILQSTFFQPITGLKVAMQCAERALDTAITHFAFCEAMATVLLAESTIEKDAIRALWKSQTR